jgi:hypothetical protein
MTEESDSGSEGFRNRLPLTDGSPTARSDQLGRWERTNSDADVEEDPTFDGGWSHLRWGPLGARLTATIETPTGARALAGTGRTVSKPHAKGCAAG